MTAPADDMVLVRRAELDALRAENRRLRREAGDREALRRIRSDSGDDSLRRTIEVDVTIAMAALDVLDVVVLDRETGTAGLTDPGQPGEDYDAANFDLAAANAAAASV